MPKLPLDDYERDALVRHLDGVSVPELVRGEATSHFRRGGSVMQLLACRRGLPAPPCSGSMDHAEDYADSKRAADLEPRVELLP